MKIKDVILLVALVGGAILLVERRNVTKSEPAAAKPPPPPVPVQVPAIAPKALEPPSPAANFATPWQDESQFIVQTIATDLVEMMVFAKSGRAPEAGGLKMEVNEVATQADGTIVYQVKVPSLQVAMELPINAAIWSPTVYQPLARTLAKKLDLTGSANLPTNSIIAELTDLRAVVIEHANAEVSAALEKDCASPALHERAALVLATFTLREHARLFFEIRTELCAMTAHLALARSLRAGDEVSVEGRLAEAALTTLYNNRAEGMKLVEAIGEDVPGVTAWKQALRTRNTGDYRIIKETPELSLLERIEKFKAEAQRLNTDVVWNELTRLPEPLRGLPDWIRIVGSNDYGVETGHELLRGALPAELNEIEQVHALVPGEPVLSRDNLVAALNVEPGRCVTVGAGGRPRVRVIGWGLWAAFLQRRLCQAITEDFRFMDKMWGVPDDAREFRQKADAQFAGLRLYPFVRRQNATDDAYYHRAQDDSMALIRREPHLIPADVWNYVSYRVPFGDIYVPPPHPFINEWHRHNPPPGTAYNPYPRMNHPSLMGQTDTSARLDRLHALAPWDHDIAYYLVKDHYGSQPTAEQLMDGYRAELEFVPDPMRKIAQASETQPAVYIEWMTRAAALNPAAYYPLGTYLVKHGRDAEAAVAYVNGMTRDPDSVTMATYAGWLVTYFEAHGQPENATALADRAAETYSYDGLEAKARLLETRKDYDQALAVYSAMVERYQIMRGLGNFLIRTQKVVPAPKYRELLTRTLSDAAGWKLPRVELKDLSSAPVNGVVFTAENSETIKAGLKPGDVIVAAQGYRVHDYPSYTVLRDFDATGPLRLILWRNGAYLELSASPPKHSFGVTMSTYTKPK